MKVLRQTTRSVRVHNLVLIQNALLEQGAMSRAQLARSIGLSRPTVSSLIEELASNEVVLETGMLNEGWGRPGTGYDMNRNKFGLVGADLGATTLDLVLTNFDGKILYRTQEDVSVIDDPKQTIEILIASIRSAVKKAENGGLTVLGVGVGVASPLVPPHDDTLSPSLYPMWQNISLRTALLDRLGKVLYLENDANLGAIGAYVWGEHREQDLIFVKMDAGVGAGAVVNGSLIRGGQGLAGEIGHLIVDPDGPHCYCGQSGCLVQYVGRDALVRISDDLGLTRNQDRPNDVYRALMEAADSLAYEKATQSVITALASAIQTMIYMLNPTAIVLGGLGATMPRLASRLNRRLSDLVPQLRQPNIHLLHQSESKPTVALGACAMVRAKAVKQPFLGLRQSTESAGVM